MSNGIEQEVTPRVNSALLSNFQGRTIRLACKLVKFNDNGSLTVSAADGGQVVVQLVGEHEPISDTYLEIVGKVMDPTTIQMRGCIGLGADLDMKLVNDTINLIHDERFYGRMFSY
ncbi:hypothetical protein CC1G_02450 [Coprinopsis cinerea okayama7|uniref:Replication factor A protein 3 n=1 Tax=Coprinopsis cinerea (strain Okayama-7 / 130 / ATCC MYA-4618 / FGSC 9003) TaxID=240176 RepID=A8NBJ0_COPC7|nr:hypothetical protein CC1G_02450 [Coprinopsis cinerea okayama7\|eukprot:XP_001832188.1 hypothetical protein CC1G_02450 [Coprinopsis cinerea okayama7\